MISILLIEDNPDDIELARRAFDRIGIAEQVYIARDGQEALDYLLSSQEPRVQREKSALPELILLDLHLPKISGLDIIRRLRSNPMTGHIPIVVLSASRKEPDLLQSFTMGVSDYFIKPIEPDRFAEVYKKYVRRAPTEDRFTRPNHS